MIIFSTESVTDSALSPNYTDEDLRAREHRLRELMVRSLAGDEAAYHKMLTDLSQHLRAYFRRRLAPPSDEVEDLVQETLLAIHNQRHTYDASRPVTAWMYGIARYKLVDLVRRRSRREQITEGLDDERDLLVASDMDASEAQRDLNLLLKALPDRQRLPIQHVKVDGRSVAEAAELTGMSIAAIKVGIHRGLKALASRLRDTP